ncbi:unnamed protein product [Fusarium graminearum]|nr:unnamed protein product [Fusarium graminearum]VTO91802.1 unnamed protein product [Fusarium graminearum]
MCAYFSTKLSPPFGFSLQFVSGLVFPSLPQISFTFSSPKFPPNKILLFLPLGIRGRLGPPLDRVYCVIRIRMSGHSYPARRLCLQPLRRREGYKKGAPLSPPVASRVSQLCIFNSFFFYPLLPFTASVIF